jgi:periplasmic copper chaperone A
MTSPSRRLVAVALAGAAFALVAGCGDDAGEAVGTAIAGGADRGVYVSDVTVIVPSGVNSAAYLTIRNDGPDDDRLVEVRSPAAGRTELHETRAEGGLMRMHAVDGVDLPAGETIRLEPGGLHVMLFDVTELAAGSTTPLELVFEHGPPQTVEATVRTHAELLG